MSQTPERRMYLAWKGIKRHGYDWYRRGEGPSPLMHVARRFRVSIRTVRRAIETEQMKND